MNSLLLPLLIALISTIIVEYVVVLVFIRKNPCLLLLYTTLINGITNPLLNYLYLYHCPVLWPLETGVIIIESLLLHVLTGTGWKKSVFCSLCANCASILVGELLF